MPNSGPQLVRAASGTGWTNPTAIEGSSSQASRSLKPLVTSQFLVGTNAPLSIPAGATITGIVVSAIGQAEIDFELGFSNIQLVLGGVPIGTAKNPAFSDWTTSPKPFNYGSSSDMWGASLTAANVNDPTFGFQASVTNFSFSDEQNASVNAYTLTVYYNTSGGGSGGGGGGLSNGGTTAPLNLALYPVSIPGVSNAFYAFDPTNFNDLLNGSFYNWKVEDVIAGRTPTINRVILSYRDLGVATITVTLSGVIGLTDANQPNVVKTYSQAVTIGTANATRKICSVVIGMNFTAANLQLSVTRAANAGPVSITKVRMEGRVEMTVY